MTEAPKRIWTEDERHIGGVLHTFTDPPPIGAEKYVVEYIRADLVRWHRIDDENNPPPREGDLLVCRYFDEEKSLVFYEVIVWGSWPRWEDAEYWAIRGNEPTHYRLIDTPEDEG